jgi:hypothetical protein
MKPDFKKMTQIELKAYVLEHRDDIEAARELFGRRSPNGYRYPAPRTQEDIAIQMDVMRRKLEGQSEER